MCRSTELHVRASSIAVRDLGLLKAEALWSAWAVVVAGQDVVGLFAEAAPIIRRACVVLCLGLNKQVRSALRATAIGTAEAYRAET